MANCGLKSIRAKVLRATLLDACGEPVAGANGTITTSGHVSIAYSDELDEGTDYLQRNGNGDLCVDEAACENIRYVNVEVVLCDVDPELVTMATGWPAVLDSAGETVGWRKRRTVRCAAGIALEAWSDVPNQACADPTLKEFNYFLLPWVTNFRIGDFTLEDGVATFPLTGGRGRAGSPWGVGPYNVVRGAMGVPSPLISPIGVDDIMHAQITTLPPPTAACGSTTLTPVEPGEGEGE